MEHLKYGFFPLPSNSQLPLYHLCEKVFTIDSMKPSRLSDHLRKWQHNKVKEVIRDNIIIENPFKQCLLVLHRKLITANLLT